MPSSRGSSRPRDRTCVPCISWIHGWMLYHCATWEAQARLCTHLRVLSVRWSTLFTEQSVTWAARGRRTQSGVGSDPGQGAECGLAAWTAGKRRIPVTELVLATHTHTALG